MKQKCTAPTAAGAPCRAWAIRGSDPPRCASHGKSPEPTATPAGDISALKHGFYAKEPAAVTIDDAIAGLVDKMQRLDALIAQVAGSPAGKRGVGDGSTPVPSEREGLLRLLELYTVASSRLSRLLRDRRALSGEAADGIAGAIAQALDELSIELGADL